MSLENLNIISQELEKLNKKYWLFLDNSYSVFLISLDISIEQILKMLKKSTK